MPSAAEVLVQPTDDPNIRAYHTRFEMTGGQEHGVRGCSEELSEFGKLIMKISGIVMVHLCPYVLLVAKAPLFEWEEVHPEIEKILKEFVISQRQIADAYANPAPPVAIARVSRRRTPSP